MKIRYLLFVIKWVYMNRDWQDTRQKYKRMNREWKNTEYYKSHIIKERLKRGSK